MNIFDEALENDGGDGFDHFHMPINTSHANTNSSLTSLASTPDLTPTPDQSLISVSNATSLQSTRHRVPTKLPPAFEYTAWLTTAYLVGYDAGIPNPLSYSEAMSGCNATQWKLGCDDEFHSLDENNIWKLVSRPRTQAVLGGKWFFKTKQDTLGQIVKYKTRWVVQGF